MDAQEVRDAYRERMHRDADQAEIDSEIENEKKYGKGQMLTNLDERANNYTGDRDFDSQSDHYDQRTNQLSAKGVAATAELNQRRAAQAATLNDLASIGSAPTSRTAALSPMTPTTLGGLARLTPALRPRQTRWWGSY